MTQNHRYVKFKYSDALICLRAEFGTLTFQKGINRTVSKKVVEKLRLAYTTASPR